MSVSPEPFYPFFKNKPQVISLIFFRTAVVFSMIIPGRGKIR
jgi:hypothetical protein